MINIALVIALISYSVVLTIYGLYVVLILKNAKTKEYIQLINQALMNTSDCQSLPNVTILVPTYNEEAVIARKLQNIAELNYPIEKIEVLLLDDCSSDRTCEIAQSMFKRLGLPGKIVRNPYRMGVNTSYNRGVPNASSSLILRTDADVVIGADALEKAVKIISNIENVGGITGTMVPVMDKITATTGVENNYRSLFDQMSIAESALHSTFPGGGGFALLKKSCFSPISPNHGSTDGNISLSIIEKDFRYICVPHTFSHETIPHKFNEQIRQKVRRASRLIQSTLMNKDMLFKRELEEFGRLIFPLRFAMLVICPVLMVAGLVCTFLLILSYSAVLALLLTFACFLSVYIGARRNVHFLNFVASMVIHQFYLLLGLIFLGKKRGTWKKTARTSRELSDLSDQLDE